MIYFIVPTYGRVLHTRAFVDSLLCLELVDYLVMVVDEHPGQEHKKEFSCDDRVVVLSSGLELWWVGAINYALRELFEEYALKNDDIVVFANNDVHLIDDSCRKIFDALKEKGGKVILHPRTIDQNGLEVSSGARLMSWFPYVTMHPKGLMSEYERIDFGTARFLVMSGLVSETVGYVNDGLLQYQGDNYYTYRAFTSYGIPTYIVRDSFCFLDDVGTGLKNSNITGIKQLFLSFVSDRSPNNVVYRYRFLRSFKSPPFSVAILLSMTINSILRYLYRLVIKKRFYN